MTDSTTLKFDIRTITSQIVSSLSPMSSPATPNRLHRGLSDLPEASGSGPTTSEVGVITLEYVDTPYGIARLVLPFDPRVDGMTVVQLPWATAYITEASVRRIDDYPQKAMEAER